MQVPWKVEAGSNVRLQDYDPDYVDEHTDPALGRAELEQLGKELGELQELMAAAHHHSLLVVLQGMDTSGKADTIHQVLSRVNPQGCEVRSFKVPTSREMDHDFLWRVHRVTPGRGVIGIFNRSHYEDVLVVRVHELVPKKRWKARYQHIADFEALLAEHNTIVLKYFLHITKKEQKKRLLEREERPETAWKLNVNDWRERERWDEYTEAYEDAIAKTAAKHAPWAVVPANAKWYRNLVVAESIAAALRPYRDEWLAKLKDIGKEATAAVRSYRAE